MYAIGVAATILILIGLELLSYIFKSIGLRSSLIVFSTNQKDIIKKIARLLNDRGHIISSYEMKHLNHTDTDSYIVTMVIKAKKNTEESHLLTLMEEFPEVTVERIE